MLTCLGRRIRRSRHQSFERDENIRETLQEDQVAELQDTPSQSAPLRRRPDYGSQVVYVGSSENPPQVLSDSRELFT